MDTGLEVRIRWVEVENAYRFNLAPDGQHSNLLLMFQDHPFTQLLIPQGLFGYHVDDMQEGANRYVSLFGNTYQKIGIFNSFQEPKFGAGEVMYNDASSENFSKISFQLKRRVNLDFLIQQLQLLGVPEVEELDWLNHVDPEAAAEEEEEEEEDVAAPPPPPVPPVEPPGDNPQQPGGRRNTRARKTKRRRTHRR